MKTFLFPGITICLMLVQCYGFSQHRKISDKKLASLKQEVQQLVENRSKMAQVMVDKVFSFSELGFHENETSRYLTRILEENGFTVQHGISGIPTAWWASWGSGKPVIAVGSDLDCIPKASQKPGVAYHDPIVEGAPGHGEGHNSGMPLNIVALLSVKEIMEREGLPGTLIVWPGIAEEQLGSKAYFTRDGYFDQVDICIFTHVSSELTVSYGPTRGTGMISVEYTFEGESAHSAGAPWRARSAADAVELMNIGWQYAREHIHPLGRSHSVINNGGDQPNVVPSKASIWYFFREITYPEIMEVYQRANEIAQAAAMMTRTKMTSRILGTAWPRHFNKVIAETMWQNIEQVGMPEWSEQDQILARAVQKEVKAPEDTAGLKVELGKIGMPVTEPVSGGSDDIGDISWKVPTVTLNYPSNIPGLAGHHWSNAIAMATPIAHKGVVAGAKVEAMTILDFLVRPGLTDQAWEYFNTEQSSKQQYIPMVSTEDKPATFLNKSIMEQYQPMIKPFYYDETKYDTYLEQLGITYPTLRSDGDHSP